MRNILLIFLLAISSTKVTAQRSERYLFQGSADSLTIHLNIYGNAFSLYSSNHEQLVENVLSMGRIKQEDSNRLIVIDQNQHLSMEFNRDAQGNHQLLKGFEFLKCNKFVYEGSHGYFDMREDLFDKDPQKDSLINRVLRTKSTARKFSIKPGSYESGGLKYEKVHYNIRVILHSESYECYVDYLLLHKGTWKQKGDYLIFYDNTFNATFIAQILDNHSFKSISLPPHLETVLTQATTH